MKTRNTFLICLLILLSGCFISHMMTIDERIKGTYVLEYPSGEIDVITVNLDSTYQRYIYNDKTHLLNNKPSYTISENWTADEKDIAFENWIYICEIGNVNTMLNNADTVSYNQARLWKKTDDTPERIVFYYEGGIIYNRIDSTTLAREYSVKR